MKDSIILLQKHGELRVIEDKLDIYLEIPHLAYAEMKKKHGGKALLFTNVFDSKRNIEFKEPVLINLFGSHKRCKFLFGRSIQSISDEISGLLKISPPSGFLNKISKANEIFSLKNIFPVKSNSRGACQSLKYLKDDIDLYKIPILTTWEQDGGPFITMAQVYTQSLDGKTVNLGMYRLQVYDKNHLGMHWQIHKDASNFFDQYQKADKMMPVTVAIGGDPLYTWCATAPLPFGVNELLLYGLIKKKSVKIVQSLTNPIHIPNDVDYVIEGWVDTSILRDEGPFGDHTGYYTPVEKYPVMKVSAITTKKSRIYLATVVGKPPLEDKYMGGATGKIFLPLLQTTIPSLIDYNMPENAGFHNLIIAKIKPQYKGHAKQVMHAFCGAGQMSFIKHAIFVNEGAPELTDYKNLTRYILNKFTSKSLFITDGILDALDHSSQETLIGGKIGIDLISTGEISPTEIIDDIYLLDKIKEVVPDAVNLVQYMKNTANPVTVITLIKSETTEVYFSALATLRKYLKIVILIDENNNKFLNPYMIIWRVTNNIDVLRDLFVSEDLVVLDGTKKSLIDGYTREWPDDVKCTKSVVDSLKERGIWSLDDKTYNELQL